MIFYRKFVIISAILRNENIFMIIEGEIVDFVSNGTLKPIFYNLEGVNSI